MSLVSHHHPAKIPSMREQRTIVDGIEFGSIFQFQRIFHAIGSSMQPSRLLIGLGMVLTLIASGRLWDSISGEDATTLSQTVTADELQQIRTLAIASAATALGHDAPEGSNEWSVNEAQLYLLEAWKDYLYEGNVTRDERNEFEQIYIALESVRPHGPFESSKIFVADAWSRIVDGGLNLDAVQMWRGAVSIVWELPQLLWQGGFHWFISLFGFLLICVMCIGGGAISRMQACWHSRSERLSVGEAIDFSIFRWRTLLRAVLAPAMFVAALTIVLMLMGFILLNVPWLNLIGGLLYGILLLIGLLISIIAVGYAACFPMLIPAVVVEDCGGSEAIQRSFAYLFSKALSYLGYLVVLVVSLVLGYLVVRLIANLTLDFTANLTGVFTFNQSLHSAGSPQGIVIPTIGLSWYEYSTGWFISVWETVVHDLTIGWVFSGFFSASTMLYLLMRNTCDGQDSRDIWWDGLIRGTNVPEDTED